MVLSQVLGLFLLKFWLASVSGFVSILSQILSWFWPSFCSSMKNRRTSCCLQNSCVSLCVKPDSLLRTGPHPGNVPGPVPVPGSQQNPNPKTLEPFYSGSNQTFWTISWCSWVLILQNLVHFLLLKCSEQTFSGSVWTLGSGEEKEPALEHYRCVTFFFFCFFTAVVLRKFLWRRRINQVQLIPAWIKSFTLCLWSTEPWVEPEIKPETEPETEPDFFWFKWVYGTVGILVLVLFLSFMMENIQLDRSNAFVCKNTEWTKQIKFTLEADTQLN